MNKQKKVIVSVSTDLATDQRVQKISATLSENGYQVLLLGRKLKNSPSYTPEGFKAKRYNLWFNNGVLFYANLNIHLFLKLLFSKYDILYANDLDVLTANYLAAKFRKKQLVYDSHEYFTEVPELVNRKKVQNFWKGIEKRIIPKLQHCITVTEKIASIYNDLYGTSFKVLRNFPLRYDGEPVVKENAIIYQGAVNIGRGLEEIIAAMPFINSTLWIAGSGDIVEKLKTHVIQLGVKDKVVFLGRLETEELRKYTQKAKLGLSIEKKLGLNYTYALPNKVFDYIQAITPVVYSDLQEVKVVLKNYEVGEELKSYEPETMAEQINRMLLSDEYGKWQSECKKAANEFNWEKEERVLLSIFEAL